MGSHNRATVGCLADVLVDITAGLPADAATTIGQLAIVLERLCAHRHNPGQLTDNGIVDGGSGSSTETEEPMYRWVAVKPEPHRSKFRVAVKKLDGKQVRHSFDSEEAAQDFIERASKKKLAGGGTKIEKAIEEYLDGRTNLKPSSVETLRFRFAAITRGRTQYPIEAFPWERAWRERAAAQSVDSQLGIRSALAGLLAWAVRQRILRKVPELPDVGGQRSKGKAQLRIDEAKRMVALAIRQRDPLALAIVTMLYTGIRPGEAMALKVRDSTTARRSCGWPRRMARPRRRSGWWRSILQRWGRCSRSSRRIGLERPTCSGSIRRRRAPRTR